MRLREGVCAVALLSLIASPALATGCAWGWLPLTSYPVGSNAGDVATADFNSDGYIDMAVVNRQHNTVTVRLGAAGGSFGSASTITLSDTTQADVAAGDFDADGKIDMVVALGNGRNHLDFLRGNGDGTFAVQLGPMIFQNPQDFTVGDFNNDGKIDVAAAAGAAGGQFATFINRGALGLTDASNHWVIPDWTIYMTPMAIASGDFDHDGNRDVVVSVWVNAVGEPFRSNVYVFYGTGDGFAFTAGGAITTDSTYDAAALAAADFNGDGRDDVVIGYRNGDGTAAGTALSVLLSGPNRTFGLAIRSAENALGQVWRMKALDVDGDGKADVVAATSPQLRVYRGDGAGSLTLLDNAPLNPLGLAIADVDLDGGPDFVMTDFSAGTASVIPSTCGRAGLTLTSSANPADEGRDFNLTATVVPPAAATPTGSLTIMRGSGVLATGSLASSLDLTTVMQDLPIGTYVFTAVYSGDSRFSSSTQTLTQTVQVPQFGPPPRLNAVSFGGPVALSWVATTGVDHYEIWRGNGAGWAQLADGVSSTPQYTDSTAVPDTAYLYKVRAISPTAVASEFSNVDVAVTITFTDDRIDPGITSVKLAHLTEMRTAVDLARSVAGLPPYPWADAAPAIVLASHWTELRSAVASVRSMLSLRTAQYTHFLAPGVTVIHAVDLSELRDAIR